MPSTACNFQACATPSTSGWSELETPEATDDWHETLLAWGAYRSGYTRSRLGYGRSVIQSMLDGLIGKVCPTCLGRRKVKDVTAGWTDCPRCKGKGRVNVATRGKINPASIPGTNPEPVDDLEPPIYARIDRALMRLTIKQRIVIITRYVDYPRRHDGERRLKHVNAWFAKIGEQPVGQKYLEARLLPEAKAELRRYV